MLQNTDEGCNSPFLPFSTTNSTLLPKGVWFVLNLLHADTQLTLDIPCKHTYFMYVKYAHICIFTYMQPCYMPIRELFPTQIESVFFFIVLSLVLFIWQHTAAFQMSKQASSQLGSTDAEHLVWSVGLEGQVKEAALLPSASRSRLVPLWNLEIYRAVALVQESTSWWNNDRGTPTAPTAPTHTWVLVTPFTFRR